MITVREGLTPELREAIAEMMPIIRPVFRVYQREAIERAVIEMAKSNRIWGIYSDGKPVGYASYRVGGDFGPNGPMHLIVHPDYHGRWLTRPVLTLMLQVMFRSQEVASVKVRGAKACRFVEKFGFRLKADMGETRLYEMRKSDALPYRPARRPRAA